MNAKTDPDSPQPSLYEWANSGTDKVAEKLKVELEKTPALHFLMNILGGFLYYAAQKLIDRKRKTGEERPKDEAVILSCSRLFSECFAGYLLARKGLVLQSIVLLRSAFEITSQARLFMEREDMARKWLEGRRIAPREVRGLSPFAGGANELYANLARLSHPNVEAIRYHTVPLRKRGAIALAYGGWFSPKSVGSVLTRMSMSLPWRGSTQAIRTTWKRKDCCGVAKPWRSSARTLISPVSAGLNSSKFGEAW